MTKSPDVPQPNVSLAAELSRHPARVIARFRRLHSEATEPPSSRRTDFNVLLREFCLAVVDKLSSDHSACDPNTCDHSTAGSGDSTGDLSTGVVLAKAGLIEACAVVVESRDFFLWPQASRGWLTPIYSRSNFQYLYLTTALASEYISCPHRSCGCRESQPVHEGTDLSHDNRLV